MTVNNPDHFFPEIPAGGMSFGEAARRIADHQLEPNLPSPCVTVWDNAVASNRLPKDLFAGPMDGHWTHDGEAHVCTFKGEMRAAKEENDWV